ncbi:DNA helicase UvrD [Candidatus Micrarchaeota archaeon]|nr:MAG: DNA helicase UvrD [Candidatus Micrarchaeota archaeon]
MRFIADLHLHSKYARATSPRMDLQGMAEGAKLKGIDVLATADFTHPLWFKELKNKLKKSEDGSGLYTYRDVRFVVGTEVSNIFSAGGKVRKIHTVLLIPSLEIAEQINDVLGKKGNLKADGRPTFGMPVLELVELVMGFSRENVVIPAHVWTPWFSLFGSMSGFDSVEECFGDQARHIFALETGLSSDPAMNWRLSALDKYALVSNSDAHSPQKMGREANVFDLQKINYKNMMNAIREKDQKRFLYTIEFFPEEGKYHYDGHRACNVCFSPKESISHNNICPECGKRLTIGVMHRVEGLADRPEGAKPPGAIPYKSIVPLLELIAAATKRAVNSVKVRDIYSKLVPKLGNEFAVLLDVPMERIKNATIEPVANAIQKMREGKVRMKPGYDGVFGELVLDEQENIRKTVSKQGRLSDFD